MSFEPSEPTSVGINWARREDLFPSPLRIIKRTYGEPTPIRRLTIRDRRKANLSHNHPAAQELIPPDVPEYYEFPGFLDGHITPPPSPHPLLNQSTPSHPTTAISSHTFMSRNHQSSSWYLSELHSSPSITLSSQNPSLRDRQQTRHCHLCFHMLKDARETYSFPTTSPSIVYAVTKLPYFPRHFPHLETEQQPVFCYTCFVHIHTLHLCWSCGLTITRPEERVSCGWAWWHWGCLACLLCRAPMTPPEWSENAGGVTLGESPACRVCRREVSDTIRVHITNSKTAEPPRKKTRSPPNEREQPTHDTSDGHFETDGAIDNNEDGHLGDDRVWGWLAKQRVMAHKGTSDKALYDGICESTEVDFSILYPPLPKWMQMLPGSVNRKTTQT